MDLATLIRLRIRIRMNDNKKALKVLISLQNETTAILAIADGAQDYFIKNTFHGNMFAKSICYSI